MNRILLVKPNSAVHNYWRPYFEKPLDYIRHHKTIPVTSEQLISGNVDTFLDIIRVLQLYPELYKEFIYGISLHFETPNAQKRKYFTSSEVMAIGGTWFDNLFDKLPGVYYFFKDEDIRKLFFLGHVGRETKNTSLLVKPGGDFAKSYNFSGLEKYILFDRFAYVARSFQLYTYGSNFDPYYIIERSILDLRMPIPLSYIKSFLKDDISANKDKEYHGF